MVNDGRDSIISWNLIGNFLHLTYRESKDKKIVRELLNFVFCEYKYLNKNYFKNSKNSREKNIVNEIKKNLKGKLDKKKNFNNEKFVIKKQIIVIQGYSNWKKSKKLDQFQVILNIYFRGLNI